MGLYWNLLWSIQLMENFNYLIISRILQQNNKQMKNNAMLQQNLFLEIIKK